jgi:hypothetical protein
MTLRSAMIAFLLASPLSADEGLWTFNNFPRDTVARKYGVTVDDKWLEHVRLSSVRLAQGCSGSFVSAAGLVMTNHHCVHSCVDQISTPEKDLVKNGFLAGTLQEEAKCPELEVNQLVSITDVTARLRKATEGLSDQKYNEAEKAEMSRIEKECATSDDLLCEVVSLYHGGIFDLYTYRRYQDVRLVFAPELSAAFFGGDPDNFNFPRYALDSAFVRVWHGGKPQTVDHYLRWSATGAKDGDVTFTAGHPGSTSRQLTVAQLEYARDVQLPSSLVRYAELRWMLTEYQHRGAEQKRHSTDLLLAYENAFKATRGMFGALVDKPFFATLIAREQQLRDAVAKKPEWSQAYGGAWDAIARAVQVVRGFRDEYNLLEVGQGLSGELFARARTLVRAAEERPKPIATRFREFRDSALPGMTQELFNPAPIHEELEIARLTYSLTKLRELLGTDHPSVQATLGKESPEGLATRVVKGTQLKDPAVRKALWDGGASAIAASEDPMIQLAKRVDPLARAVRKRLEDEYEAPLKKNTALLAKARFAIQGTSTYPDATFTLRLSYGQVKGWTEPSRTVAPFTRLGGAFERATGNPPFDLPERWLKAKDRLALDTPFDFVTNNDIVGGSSGSPVIDAKGEVIGLVFDGNIHSLGGDYGFDETKNRAVAVHTAAIVEALTKIYGAERLVKELRP